MDRTRTSGSLRSIRRVSRAALLSVSYAALGVIDPGGQAGRRESGKNDRMDNPNASACQHGKNRLGNHWQVDDSPITAFQTERLQDSRKRGYLTCQFAVGERTLRVHFSGNEMQSDLICPTRQMPIDRVVAKIGFATDEPPSKRRPSKITDLMKRLVPKNEF